MARPPPRLPEPGNGRSATPGISGRLTKTFTAFAQANRTHRWLAALLPAGSAGRCAPSCRQKIKLFLIF
ncbi:MAG: hypothetical protein MPL62_03955 [Alphaproteobacteria bacterium]|nr:hypothetical protein [Alphaproteobacteria bacterium]